MSGRNEDEEKSLQNDQIVHFLKVLSSNKSTESGQRFGAAWKKVNDFLSPCLSISSDFVIISSSVLSHHRHRGNEACDKIRRLKLIKLVLFGKIFNKICKFELLFFKY